MRSEVQFSSSSSSPSLSPHPSTSLLTAGSPTIDRLTNFVSAMTTPDQENDLPAQYDAGGTEHALYQEWEAAGVFRAEAAQSTRSGGKKSPYVLVMPPPNVTAILHVGHGLNNTVQDVLTRWRRMSGDDALWVPGTDHAGIATQNVVEKQLAAEGKTRDDLGRDAFVERVRTFAETTRGEILQQLRVIGSSADWTRTAYTFSP